ncbi:MAG TPA: HAMP domain-containing sensor histidine kinase [Acetobacteraceae bacterium]|nr:HAMP domain-containing sensor histidine kinase [Acetobacteraceae bacterium]
MPDPHEADPHEARQRQGERLFRMASFRLAVLGMLLSSLGAILTFALIYGATGQTVRAALTASIRDERSELMADMRHDHLTLAQAVNRAIRSSPGTFFSLSGADDRVIAGNLPVPGLSYGWQSFSRLDGIALPAGILAVDGMAMPAPGGGTLFIGKDASWLAALNSRIAYVFGAVFGAMTALGLGASLLIAHYSLQRVRAISDASREIMAGDLSRRIKLYGRDDELDRLTEDLNAMLGRIQLLVENVRQVTNDVAHDLRSPLTRLRERLELARADPAHPAAAPAFEAALAQVDEIVGIFDSLLRIAEIEASVSRAGFVRVDLTALLEFLAESYETVADDRGQSLAAEIEAGLAMRGERNLLVQMLTNLIENAIRHCPPGSTISLSGRRIGAEVEILVADDGPGVPEAERERVLRRFVRLDASRHSPGNGLGLALVSAVVALHEGAISLQDNTPGLRVHLRFPAATDRTPPDPS